MRKPSEILGGVPFIGAYIRFEKWAIARTAAAWERHKNRSTYADKMQTRLRNAPYIGPLVRFPGAAREWLEDLPVAGPLAFRPAFGLTAWLFNTLLVRPEKFLRRYVALPLVVAGGASAALYANPDAASDTLEDYLRHKGIDAALFDGVTHSNIRVYKDNVLTLTFHAAAHEVAANIAMDKDSVPLVKAFRSALQYPSALFSSAVAAAIAENAFALPAIGNDGACFIRPLGEDIDPLEMVALLSSIPEKHLALDRAQLEWVPLMVLGHEGRHCDNAKATMAALEELQAARDELNKVRTRELAALMGEENFNDALEALEDNPAYKQAAENVTLKARAVDRATLAGETDSDIYVVPIIERLFPGKDAASVMLHARAVSPFAGKMGSSNSHSTASGLETHINRLEGVGPYDVWDALEMGKFLIRFGAFLNVSGAPPTGFDKTLENYHVAKTVVIPYLERNRDAYLPRDERHVRYALVLDQVRLFVEGMEHLVKPQSLERSKPGSAVDIPDMPVRRIQPVPVRSPS